MNYIAVLVQTKMDVENPYCYQKTRKNEFGFEFDNQIPLGSIDEAISVFMPSFLLPIGHVGKRYDENREAYLSALLERMHLPEGVVAYGIKGYFEKPSNLEIGSEHYSIMFEMPGEKTILVYRSNRGINIFTRGELTPEEINPLLKSLLFTAADKDTWNLYLKNCCNEEVERNKRLGLEGPM